MTGVTPDDTAVGRVLAARGMAPGTRLYLRSRDASGAYVHGVDAGMNRVVRAAQEAADTTGQAVQILRSSPSGGPGDTVVNTLLPRGVSEPVAAAPRAVPPPAARAATAAGTGRGIPAGPVSLLSPQALAEQAQTGIPAVINRQVEGHIQAIDQQVAREGRQGAAGEAARLRDHLTSAQAEGLVLPALLPVPKAVAYRVAVNAGDAARARWIEDQAVTASEQLGAAHRAIRDASAGLTNAEALLKAPGVRGATRRYLDELVKETTQAAEILRVAERHRTGVPDSFFERLKAALGTDHIGFVAPGTDILMQAWPRLGFDGVMTAVQTWGRYMLVPMDRVIGQVPSGREFLARLDRTQQWRQQFLGQRKEAYLAFLRLRPEERRNVADVIERGAAPLNDRTAQQAQYWKGVFADVSDQLTRARFKTYDPYIAERLEGLWTKLANDEPLTAEEQTVLNTGPWRDYHPRANYWPNWVKRDVMTRRNAQQRIQQALTEKYLRTGMGSFGEQVTTEEAARAAARYATESIFADHGQRFGHIEFARTVDQIPSELRAAPEQELLRYLLQASHAVSLARGFGPHFPVASRMIGEKAMEWEGAQTLMADIEREARAQGLPAIPGGGSAPAAHADYAFRLYSGEGALTPLDQQLVRGARSINSAMVIGSMTLSAVWKITQPFTNLPLRTAWRDLAGALYDFAVGPRAVLRSAGEAGALIDDVFHSAYWEASATPMTEWSRRFLTINGFIPAVSWSRAIAAAAGKRYARRMADRLVHNPNDRWARQELGLLFDAPGEVDRIVAARGLTPEQFNQAGYRISRDVEFVGRSDLYPQFWASPQGQLATLFHRFMWMQSRFLIGQWNKRTWPQRLQMLAVLAPTWFAVGDLAQSLHSHLSGQQRPLVMQEVYDAVALGKQDVPTQTLLTQILESTMGWAVLGYWGGIFNTILGPHTSTERVLGEMVGPAPAKFGAILYHGGRAALQGAEVAEGQRPADRQTMLMALDRDLLRMVPFAGRGLAQQAETPHARYLRTRREALAAWDAGDFTRFAVLNGDLLDEHAPITVAELLARERKKMDTAARQAEGLPAQVPLPGEPDYVPVRR